MSGAGLATVAALLLQARSPKPPVVTVGEPSAVELAPGGTARARVAVTIAPGFHVQANPASGPTLIPLRLELHAEPPLRLGDPVYPPGKGYRLQGSDLELSVYDGTVEVSVSVEAAKNAALIEKTLEGSLRYQACDDRVCLPPRTVPVRVPVRVFRGGSARSSSRPGPRLSPSSQARHLHRERAACVGGMQFPQQERQLTGEVLLRHFDGGQDRSRPSSAWPQEAGDRYSSRPKASISSRS
jgi:hypothetical protein